MFDEFMEELRRRQAGATGERARRRPGDPPADEPDPDAELEEPISISGRGGPNDGARSRADGPEDGGTERGARTPPRPRPGPSSRRGAGGQGRGGGGRRLRRRFGMVFGGILVLAILLMLVVGRELWTDAIWYTSVGYSEVFWRRIGIQVALFAAGTAVALLVLLFNLWLAGRLLPPAGTSGLGSSLRTFIDRLN